MRWANFLELKRESEEGNLVVEFSLAGWLVVLSEAGTYFSNAVMVMLSNDTVKIIRNTGNEWPKEP